MNEGTVTPIVSLGDLRAQNEVPVCLPFPLTCSCKHPGPFIYAVTENKEITSPL